MTLHLSTPPSRRREAFVTRPVGASAELRPATPARIAATTPQTSTYPRWLALGGTRWTRLFVPIVLLRLSAVIWGIANVDETTFLVFARMLHDGAAPYVGVVDNKPILTYLAFAPSWITGWHLWPLHLLAMLWVFATAWLLGRVVERWTGDREAGWTAAWLTALATCCAIPSVSSELLLNLPIAAALLYAWRARWPWDFVAGLLIAVGSLFKHQAGIALVAVGLGVLLDRRQSLGARSLRSLALGFGFLVPWLAVGLWFWSQGYWAGFYDWNITRNIAYSAPDPSSPLRLLGEAVAVTIVLSAPVAWVLAVRAVPSSWRDPFGKVVALLFCLTWIPVSLGGRFYQHYFLQFVVPVAVLAAPSAAELVRHWADVAPRWRKAIAVGMAIPALVWVAYGPVRGFLGGMPAQDPKAVEIADWIRTHSQPEDRVFLWGSYSPVYYLAERTPGTRYIDSSVLAGNFDPSHIVPGVDLHRYQSKKDIEQTLLDLEHNRPALFVDTAPANLHDWGHFPLSDFPALNAYVREHYAPAGTAAGAIVYRRRPEFHRVAGLD